MSGFLVPADFGLNKLKSRLHGNVLIALAGGKQLRANSVILSLNSPVFEGMFSEMDPAPELDLTEYSSAAVQMFMEAVYTGKVTLDTVLVRDVYKMAYVFKVAWLRRRCESYLGRLVCHVDRDDYNSLFYLFEEARCIAEMTTHKSLLNELIEKITRSQRTKTDFVTRYMADYKTLSKSQLELMINVTRDNPTILVKIVIQHIEANDLMFDDATEYILTNLDLLSCLLSDKVHYDCLFDLLFEKVVNLSFDDLKLIVTLHKATFGAYMESCRESTWKGQNKNSDRNSERNSDTESRQSDMSGFSTRSNSVDSLPVISRLESAGSVRISPVPGVPVDTAKKQSSSLPTLPMTASDVSIISNASTIANDISIISNVSTVASDISIISNVSTVDTKFSDPPKIPTTIKNLFHSGKSLQKLSFHGIIALKTVLNITNVSSLFMVIEALTFLPNMSTYQAIELLKSATKEHNWARIPPKFLESFARHPHTQLVQQIKKTLALCSTRDCLQLESKNFTTLHDLVTKGVTVQFQLPARFGAGRFSLHVQPFDNERNFEIKLQDTKESQVSAENLHLLVKEWDSYRGNKLLNRHVTWCERPVVRRGKISWGEVTEFRRIKLVVYCDVRL